MKKTFSVWFFVMIATFSGFSQKLEDLSQIPTFKNGKIILMDGTIVNFKDFSANKDSVIVTNSKSVVCKYSKNEIYKLSKTGNNFAVSALSCGVGGLLGSILGTSDWNNTPELKDKKSSFIVGATVVSTVIGGIIGAFITKEKILYKSSKLVSFNTKFDFINKNNPSIQFGFNFNISSK